MELKVKNQHFGIMYVVEMQIQWSFFLRKCPKNEMKWYLENSDFVPERAKRRRRVHSDIQVIELHVEWTELVRKKKRNFKKKHGEYNSLFSKVLPRRSLNVKGMYWLRVWLAIQVQLLLRYSEAPEVCWCQISSVQWHHLLYALEGCLFVFFRHRMADGQIFVNIGEIFEMLHSTATWRISRSSSFTVSSMISQQNQEICKNSRRFFFFFLRRFGPGHITRGSLP